MGLVAFPTVTRMEGVRHLVLSNNALTALPDDIGLLEELVELNVRGARPLSGWLGCGRAGLVGGCLIGWVGCQTWSERLVIFDRVVI